MQVPTTDDAAQRRARSLDRQVQRLVDAGHPQLAGLSDETLRALVRPLHDLLPGLPDAAAGLAAGDPLDLVLVVPDLVPPEQAVTTTRMGSRSGFTSMEADDLAGFRPRADVGVPDAPAYLLLGVDVGAGLRGVPPQDALPRITAAGRSPLTVDEGLAVVLQVEGVLVSHGRFSLLGSRCGDRRVPALWVSDRRPRLGWCWDGAPHDWLGSASCAGRVA